MTSAELHIDEFGELAWQFMHRRLEHSGGYHVPMTVIAQFQQCLYLAPVEAGPGSPGEATEILCVGTSSIGRGPLNVLIESGFQPDQFAPSSATAVRYTTTDIHFPASTRLVFNADMIKPSPRVTDVDIDSVWSLLEDYARPALPAGLGTPLFETCATRAIAVLTDFLLPALRTDATDVPASVDRAIRDLVGLGPGLTPAGDDFLAGVLLSLQSMQRKNLAASLARCVLRASETATNRISAAFLRAAADGYCGATLAEVFAGLARADRDRLERAVVAQTATGHTSGRDAWHGVLLTFSCAVGQPGPAESTLRR